MPAARSPFERPLPQQPPCAPVPSGPPPAPGRAAGGGGAAADDARAERLARLAQGRKSGGASRRAHPSKTARTIALVSSVVATGGVAAAMASADATPPVESAAGVIIPAGSGSGTASTSTAAGSTSTAAGSTSTAAGTTSRSASSTALYADGTWTGAAEWTRWGYVQVQATVKNGKITDVTAVQSPNDGRSRSINSRAQPVLEQEAIAAQSTDIDMVSGATYTSRTYSASLQAALDKAAQAVTTAKAGQS
jgi:uncharacterized protein with FMN-binding domain